MSDEDFLDLLDPADGDGPRCDSCDSPNLEFRDGEFPTGVVAPDGYAERRYEAWMQCLDCGAREDMRDFDRRMKEAAEAEP